jgi:hypothetical protein
MGLSERDYMNERRAPEVKGWEKPSSEELSTRSILWTVLIWVSVLFVVYKSFLWWDSQGKPLPPFSPGIAVDVHRTAPVEGGQVIAPQVPLATQQSSLGTRLTPAHSGERTVKKCLVNGQTAFTDRECPSGAKESSLTVNTANLGTVVPRVSPVPPAQSRNTVTTTTTYSTNAVAGNVSSNSGECGYLEMQIKQIDALSRQPQSGQSQDALSAQRKKVRSRQYELHC